MTDNWTFTVTTLHVLYAECLHFKIFPLYTFKLIVCKSFFFFIYFFYYLFFLSCRFRVSNNISGLYLSESASFIHRMAAPTITSINNHYTCITQIIQIEYLHMHKTSNLTIEKKNKYHLLNMIYCFNIFYQFLKRSAHDSHSPCATNTQKCESL